MRTATCVGGLRFRARATSNGWCAGHARDDDGTVTLSTAPRTERPAVAQRRYPLVLLISAAASNERAETCAPLTRSALYAIVKDVFARAAARLREREKGASARADLLEKASAHRLRHSGGSHMADSKVDLRMVRDKLGHASLTTTSIYLHVDDDRRHKKIEAKDRVDW
jgi:integrase